jgi:hypothetical protein
VEVGFKGLGLRVVIKGGGGGGGVQGVRFSAGIKPGWLDTLRQLKEIRSGAGPHVC